MLLLILVTLASVDVCECFSYLITTEAFAGLSLLLVREENLGREGLMDNLHSRDLVGGRKVIEGHFYASPFN